MEAIIKYFAGEYRVIVQAPVTFLIALGLLGGAIWAVLSWSYAARFSSYDAQIANLQSRLTLRDDQISDYKSKLGGATPDEIRKRLDSLDAQLQYQAPRRLVDKQITAIRREIARFTGSVEIWQDMSVGDAKAFQNDLMGCFQSAGWQARGLNIMGPGSSPRSGTGLLVPDPSNLTEKQEVIRKALQLAGLRFDLMPLQPRLDPASLPSVDAVISITTRLE